MYGGPPPPVMGRWELVSMQVDKKEPDKDDPMHWSWLDFSSKKVARLAGPKPPNVVYAITWDTENKKLTLAKLRPPTSSATFTYDLPEPDKLELQGSMDGKAIAAALKRSPRNITSSRTAAFNGFRRCPTIADEIVFHDWARANLG